MSKSSLEETSLEQDYQTDKTWRQRAYRDMEFIKSPAARPVRILSEIIAPGQTFEQEQIYNTIVFFGSARSIDQEQAQTNLEAAEKAGNLLELGRAKMAMKLAHYYEQAAILSKHLSEWSMEIVQPEKRFTICSGGGPGMMEAANRGANEAGASSIGLNIALPHEQMPNPYQTPRISFEFHYFFTRKYWFANQARCLIVFPGGYGTMDELFEFLTLRQTGKIVLQMPIVLFGREFWEDFLNFDQLLKWGVINQQDMELFTIMDDPDEAFEYIKTSLIEELL